MTKKDFLHKLKIELGFHLSSQERQAVIEDYEEYFDSALYEGKTEEETCKQLGDIEKLAKEIIGNDNKKKPIWIRNLTHKINDSCHNVYFINIVTILPLIVGLGLWIKYKGWFFWAYLLHRKIELMYVGPSALGNISFLILAFISLSLACLIWSNRNSSLSRIFQVPFYIGAAVSLGDIGRLLKSLSEPNLFLSSLLRAMIPLLCGIIISIILFFKLTLFQRGGSKNDSTI